MKLHLTKAERERYRIEESERIRRFRAGEEHREPNVVLPDPEAVKALRDYDRAVRDLVKQVLPPGGVEPPSCEAHDWPPPGERGNGRPPKPASMCPDCLASAERGRRPAHSADIANRPVFVAHPQYPDPSAYGAQKWEEHLERLEARGVLLAGSPQERAAVDRSDDLRAELLRQRRHVHTVRVRGGEGGLIVYRPKWRWGSHRRRPVWYTERDDGSITVEA